MHGLTQALVRALSLGSTPPAFASALVCSRPLPCGVSHCVSGGPFEDRRRRREAAEPMVARGERAPRSLQQSLPEPLDAWVLTLLKKDPNARFQTCAEAAQNLRSVRWS